MLRLARANGVAPGPGADFARYDVGGHRRWRTDHSVSSPHQGCGEANPQAMTTTGRRAASTQTVQFAAAIGHICPNPAATGDGVADPQSHPNAVPCPPSGNVTLRPTAAPTVSGVLFCRCSRTFADPHEREFTRLNPNLGDRPAARTPSAGDVAGRPDAYEISCGGHPKGRDWPSNRGRVTER